MSSSTIMKILLAAAAMSGGTAGHASGRDQGCDADYELSPQVMELVSRYGKTAAPLLPEPERWDEIDCEVSATPGRMRVPRHVVVDKPHTRLYVINAFGDTIYRSRVCASVNRGQKEKMDDCRTPEGTFRLMGIYDSTDWKYKDTQDKCYGPYFISLITPRFWGIGIHGTNSPWSVPGRRSHGCMRMHNEDVTTLHTLLDKDSYVIITPDPTEQ